MWMISTQGGQIIRPEFGTLGQLPLNERQTAQLLRAADGTAPAGEAGIVTPREVPRLLQRFEIARKVLQCAAASSVPMTLGLLAWLRGVCAQVQTPAF